MSLRAQVKSAIQAGMAAIGDLAQRATYISTTTPSYNPTTGAISSPSTSYTGLAMVFSNFSRMEIDGDAVRAEDQKVLVATLDLIPIPTINDRITDEDGVEWNIIGILSVPGMSIWKFHVRRM